MIKLVIADDEERVCRLINALGDWDALGIQVAGMASNGVEALELLGHEKVDILITDIRMPGYNGLELIERVRKISETTKIIIISGYANFEYAQTALKHGVSDYLLKPINKEALNSSLRNLADQIREGQRQQQIVEDTSRERAEERSQLRRKILSDLVGFPGMELTDEVLKSQYHFRVEKGRFRIYILKLDLHRQEMSPEVAAHFWKRAEEAFLTESERSCIDHVHFRQEDYLYGLIHYSVREEEAMRRALRTALNHILARKEIYGLAELSLGLGQEVTEASELGRSLLSARNRIDERLLVGTGKLIDGNVQNQVLLGKRLLDKYTRNVGNAIENLDRQALASAADEIGQQALDTRGVHGWEIMELVTDAGSLFAQRMEIPDKKEVLRQFRQDCENCTQAEALFDTLKSFTVGQLDAQIAQREEDSVRPVRLARQYIHQHYMEQITLEEVSEKAGLTPAYFSALFKKETDVGFAKYLMNERIEAAKELLRESSLSVQEICRRVGYNDQKHFIHIFEKTVGVKPAVYRKMYG